MEIITKFTEKSNNPNNYGELHANLKTPYSQYSTLVIDSLTTNCCFEVLNNQDYITFNETKQQNNDNEEEETTTTTTFTILIKESYSSLNSETVSTMLNDLLNTAESNIRSIVDNTNRLVFQNKMSFSIVAASYRMKEVLGIFDQTFPIDAEEITDNEENPYSLQCLSVGNFLSTAILYLVASIGDKVFINSESGRTNRKILMRINNSYSANFPIIANNAEFSTYALSNDFSDITFELVDARFNPIKLLSPLYLTGTITADVKAETINTSILITPDLLEKNNDNVDGA